MVINTMTMSRISSSSDKFFTELMRTERFKGHTLMTMGIMPFFTKISLIDSKTKLCLIMKKTTEAEKFGASRESPPLK